MSRSQSRQLILHYITEFCLLREMSDGSVYTGLKSSRWRATRTPAPGALVALQHAPPSKWHLSWVRSFSQNPGHHDITYMLESIDDGEVGAWSNVSLLQFDMKTVQNSPHWRWTDEQHEFNDRWLRLCRDERDAYIVVPVQSVFYDAEDGEPEHVYLETRTRWGLDDLRFGDRLYDWRSATDAQLLAVYDNAVARRETLKQAEKTNADNTAAMVAEYGR